jgi:hypothetical protein
MEIKYTIKDNQINIFFAKNLIVSESLKKAIKNIQFNFKEKFWFTTIEQEPFIINWIPKAQKLALKDELAQAKNRNADILAGIKEAERDEALKADLLVQIEQMSAVLKENLTTLNNANLKLRETTAKHNDAVKEIEALISTMLDINALRAIANQMSKNMHYSVKGNRERFDLAQDEALVMRRIVREAGFRFDALERIAGASFNRPDRDDPKNIPAQSWYKITKMDS